MPGPYFAEPYGNADHCMVENMYKIASEGRVKERLLMILLSMEGRHAPEIAEIVHRDTDTVLTRLHRWNEEGFDGLHDRIYPGRPPALSSEEQNRIVRWVSEEVESGKRLTCRQISLYIAENMGKTVDHDTVRRMLHSHNRSWQKPGTRDHRADPALQEQFGEQLRKRMETEPEVRFFFADEVFFSLTTTAAHTWGEKGNRTVLKANLSREKIIDIGAVEPLTGENFHIFVPETTKNVYEIFVREFAKAFPGDRIVLIHDGAPWHNITPPDDRIELWKLPRIHRNSIRLNDFGVG